MKVRWKWVLVLGAVPLGLLVIYLLIVLGIGLMPTNYRQAEAQWATEAQKLESQKARDESKTKSPKPVPPAVGTITKAQPDSFASCWAAFLSASPKNPDPRKPSEAVDYRITGRVNDFISRHDGRQEFAPRGSMPFPAGNGKDEAVIRRQLAEPMREAAARLDGKWPLKPGGKPQGQSYLSWALGDDAISTKNLALIRNTPPHPAVSRLLHLPSGSVPHLPMGAGLSMNTDGWNAMPALGQAWLYALAHEPDFDPALGLRRLFELQLYMKQEIYPRWTNADLNHLVILAAHCDLVSSRTCRLLADELMRQDHAEQSEANRVALHRHQAKVMHAMMIAQIEYLYKDDRASINDNAFSFFLSGKPARLWFKANYGLVRRQIDKFALAIGTGKPPSVKAAGGDLIRVAGMANLKLDFWYQRVSDAQRGFSVVNFANRSFRPITNYIIDALEMSLWCYRRDHGRLPERMADLIPDYLPESIRRQILDNQTWVIQDHPCHPVLWHVVVHNEKRPSKMEFEQAIRDAPKRFEQMKGRPMTAEERAEFERYSQDMHGKLTDSKFSETTMRYAGFILF